jgi:Peroxiredoxin
MLTSRIARPLLINTFTASRVPFFSSSFRKMTLTTLPSVEVMQGFPDVKKINLSDYCAGKNVILVGLPGAFTPT